MTAGAGSGPAGAETRQNREDEDRPPGGPDAGDAHAGGPEPPAGDRPRTVREGIPFGNSFLHVVRADVPGYGKGRWAVVADFSRQGAQDRILTAAAFRFDRLPARAALEMGVALFEGLTTAHARSPAARSLDPVRVPARAETAHDRDVYAASATVVELLTGEPLAPAPGDDPEPRIDAACDEVRRRLGVSAAAEAAVAILRVGLARDPRDRPAARDLAAALADVARSAPGEGLDAFARRVTRRIAPAPTVGARVRVAVPAPRPIRPRPWLELGVALGSLTMAVGVLLVALILLIQLRG